MARSQGFCLSPTLAIGYLDYLLDNVLIIFKEEYVPIVHKAVKLCHVLTRLQLCSPTVTKYLHQTSLSL